MEHGLSRSLERAGGVGTGRRPQPGAGEPATRRAQPGALDPKEAYSAVHDANEANPCDVPDDVRHSDAS